MRTVAPQQSKAKVTHSGAGFILNRGNIFERQQFVEGYFLENRLAMSDKNESMKSVLGRLSGDLVDENCSDGEDRNESIDDAGVVKEERGEITTTKEKVREYI